MNNERAVKWLSRVKMSARGAQRIFARARKLKDKKFVGCFDQPIPKCFLTAFFPFTIDAGRNHLTGKGSSKRDSTVLLHCHSPGLVQSKTSYMTLPTGW